MSAPASFGAVSPRDLVDQRLQLHSAAQMVGWLGRRILPASYGPIRAALFWDGRHDGTLTGASISGSAGAGAIRVAVAFDPASILVLEGETRTVRDRLELNGVTVADTWTRLTAALGGAGISTRDLPPLPVDQLPSDDLRSGGPFRIEPARAAELGHWYGFASELLTEQAVSNGLDPAVPCWSHHFDMAVVLPLVGHDKAQVTLGFSPGDDSIPEPYLYALPWPAPADLAVLPQPPSPGRWQRDGWTGLALAGSVLLADPRAGDPAAAGRSFLERGLEIAGEVALAG